VVKEKRWWNYSQHARFYAEFTVIVTTTDGPALCWRKIKNFCSRLYLPLSTPFKKKTKTFNLENKSSQEISFLIIYF
jgi:hypothetical protein